MRFAVVDDEDDHRSRLLRAVERYCIDRGIESVGEQFATVESFRAAYAADRFDVVFLDCYFETDGTHASAPPPTGMDAARWLRAHGYDNPIIFSTYSTDFAVEGYRVDAAAYMVKPYGQNDVNAALDKVLRAGSPSRRTVPAHIVELPIGARTAASFLDRPHADAEPYGSFYVVVEGLDGNALLRFDADRLAYCRADRHYVEVYDAHAPATAAFTLRMGLSSVEARLLRMPQFFACARGYIVNLDQVCGMDGESFMLADDVRVPISRRRLAQARARYSDRVFHSMRERASS